MKEYLISDGCNCSQVILKELDSMCVCVAGG